MHERPIALRRLLHLRCKQHIERDRRNRRAIVFKPDGVFEHQNGGRRGIIPGEIDGQHAAEGMADNRRPGDAEMIEKRLGVAGEKIEMIAERRLARFAEAELIGRHHAIALRAQQTDHAGPIGAGKALAMQKDDHFAIRFARRRDIHIGHAERLALDRQIQEMHRIGISDPFQTNAERLVRRGSGRRRCKGKDSGEDKSGASEAAEHEKSLSIR